MSTTQEDGEVQEVQVDQGPQSPKFSDDDQDQDEQEDREEPADQGDRGVTSQKRSRSRTPPPPTRPAKQTFQVLQKFRPPRRQERSRRSRSPPPARSTQDDRRRRNSPLPYLPRRRHHHQPPVLTPYVPPMMQFQSAYSTYQIPLPQPEPLEPRFQRDRLLVVQLSGMDEKQQMAWKDIFRRSKFMLYDCKYPFRIGGETILRRNKAYKQPSRFAKIPDDQFVAFIYDQTSAFFGTEFEYDYFMDWFTNLSPRDRQSRVVVFGVGQNPSAINMLAKLRRHGAVVVSTPNLPGDYIMHNVRDLERFVNDLR